MGRGTIGVLNQAIKKMTTKNEGDIAKIYGRVYKSDEKICLHEDTLDLMKNMSQKELVDFLLSNANASG